MDPTRVSFLRSKEVPEPNQFRSSSSFRACSSVSFSVVTMTGNSARREEYRLPGKRNETKRNTRLRRTTLTNNYKRCRAFVRPGTLTPITRRDTGTHTTYMYTHTRYMYTYADKFQRERRIFKLFSNNIYYQSHVSWADGSVDERISHLRDRNSCAGQ